MGPTLYPSSCYFDACIKGMVDDLASGQTFELGPHKGTAFAWLHMLELDNGVEVVVELDTQPIPEIASSSHFCNDELLIMSQ